MWVWAFALCVAILLVCVLGEEICAETSLVVYTFLMTAVIYTSALSYFLSWYNCHGWLGIKNQLSIYLVLVFFSFFKLFRWFFWYDILIMVMMKCSCLSLCYYTYDFRTWSWSISMATAGLMPAATCTTWTMVPISSSMPPAPALCKTCRLVRIDRTCRLVRIDRPILLTRSA